MIHDIDLIYNNYTSWVISNKKKKKILKDMQTCLYTPTLVLFELGSKFFNRTLI